MPRETVAIDLSVFPFEASAQFLAVLIEPTDARAREQLALAECHRQLLDYKKTDPRWGELIWAAKYSLFDSALAEKLHRSAMRILETERMIAAELGLAFIFEAFVKAHGGAGLELREDGKKIGPLSPLEDFSLWALRQQRRLAGRFDDPDKLTPKTFEQRAWRKTKPVLHLALAIHAMVRGKTTADGGRIWAAMFEDKRETEKLLYRAELFQQVLLEIAERGRFKLSAKDTVQVIAG